MANKVFRATKNFGESVLESVTDWGHEHIVAPKGYDEPETPEDGSRLRVGLMLLAMSAISVASCAALVVFG